MPITRKDMAKYQIHGGHHISQGSNYFAGPVKLINRINNNNKIIK